MAARFWVGGTGNWDAATTTHWATSGGGAGGASVPGSGDTVTFDANSGTAATVTVTATAAVTSVTINKADLTLLLNAPVNLSGDMTVTTGTLNTNGQDCSWASLSSSNTNTRTITLGASELTLSSTTTPWFTATTTGLTFNAGTSTITFSGNGPSLISLGSRTYYDVMVSNVGSGSVSIAGGTNTFHNLTIQGGASRTGSVQTQAIVCTGTLAINGNSVTNQLLVRSSAPGNRRTYTAAARDISNVTFQDITAAGDAAPFSGSGLGDGGGNANINFDEGLPLYRTGAGGNWSDLAAWATDAVDDDGVARTPRVPMAQDTVVVDSRASGTITLDMPRLGRGLDLTGFAGTIAPSVPITLYGSLTLSNAPTFALSGTQPLTLAGRDTQLITSNGKIITQALRIEAPGGTYSLQDNLTGSSSLTLTYGTLDSNDHDVTIASFASTTGNNVRTLMMGSGTWTLTGIGTVWNVTANTALTVDADASTILIANTSGSAKTFTGNGRAFHDLTFAGGSGTLTMGGSTFATVTWPPGSSIILTADTTTTVGDLDATGAAGDLITVTSSVADTPAAIRKFGGTVVLDYLSLRDSSATGTAQWYAGVHSADVGGNTGWQFTDPSPGTNRFLPFFAGQL